MRFANLTDVGREREHNEDNLLSTFFSFGHGSRRIGFGLHVVADGMGGAAAGEVASSITVETIIRNVFENLLRTHMDSNQGYLNLGKVVRAALEEANQMVWKLARENTQYLGMGATCTTILTCQGRAFIGQVGDSRAYMLRGGELRQITRDHSFVGEMVRDGRLTEEQARVHPRKNIITRAIGSRYAVQVDVFFEELRPGDMLLACSDGLSGMVTDPEMRTLLSQGIGKRRELSRLCEDLVQKANSAGGTDNITVTLVWVDQEDIPARPLDQIAFSPDSVLTWDEASRLDLEDWSFIRVEA
ncbi:MAG: Stp1/IreP family PP2C-type Ser/Thr phosphatase [Candidatus Riflebacteria bacterium]|nr:Stp1/IreP family PP2C-type Ser/Thr phosphatase [Candidatus Riflebacteria bacterium]